MGKLLVLDCKAAAEYCDIRKQSTPLVYKKLELHNPFSVERKGKLTAVLSFLNSLLL